MNSFEKKVDESWKQQAVRGVPVDPAQPQTEKAFMNLLNSLGLQAMIHLGGQVR